MIHHSESELRVSWRHTPSEVERSFGIWLVSAGRTQARLTYHVGPRIIEHHIIHVVLDGNVHLRAQRAAETTTLSRGDGFALFPGLVYEYWAAPDDPPRMTWIRFDGPAARTALDAVAKPELPGIRGLGTRQFISYVNQLDGVFETAGSWRPMAYLAGFLAAVHDGVAQPDAHKQPTWLEQGRALLDSHCTDGITVKEVADQVGVDRSHFSKEFTRTFGITPNAHLRHARLSRAQELLRDPTLSVTEIAMSVGYADLYSFSHAYRQQYGRAPSSIRGASGLAG